MLNRCNWEDHGKIAGSALLGPSLWQCRARRAEPKDVAAEGLGLSTCYRHFS
jgi:hypothetical protein